MTFKIEPKDECAFCHQIAELRPYGPNGERICFKCAMKDEETTTRKFLESIEEQILQ
jgi:hypothetical protein